MWKAGEGVLELSIGHEKVKDGHTDLPIDRPTCAEQYAISSLNGGIIIYKYLSIYCLNKRLYQAMEYIRADIV